jgi:hypothetical protein
MQGHEHAYLRSPIVRNHLSTGRAPDSRSFAIAEKAGTPDVKLQNVDQTLRFLDWGL